MRDLCRLIGWMVVDLIRSRVMLEAEIWTLRQQINVLRRTAPKKLSFCGVDRMIFVGLYRLFPKICDALAIVKPDTLVRWHRAGERRGSTASFSSSASISGRRAWPSIWPGVEARRPKVGKHFSIIMPTVRRPDNLVSFALRLADHGAWPAAD